MKALVKVLRDVGKKPRTYSNPDGSRLLILPHGGRVLGLYSGRSEDNFYWTHDALGSTKTASKFYAGDQWHNSGGDRTWLAPEVDLFFPKYPKLDRYFQQRSLDPGAYRVTESNGSYKLTNKLIMRHARANIRLPLEITKSFGSAANPLRYERGFDSSTVEYAGYTQYTTLKLRGSSKRGGAQVGLWNLVQMPHGGELLIPTYHLSKPRHIFSSIGSIPGADLTAEQHGISYRMHQQGEHKISVRAVAVCGRVGYRYRRGDKWNLIVRNFSVNLSGEYVDAPWSDLADLGYVVQACNVNSALGVFSELEYHIPAIGDGTGRSQCYDEAQVWAFRGEKKAIELAGRLLLGM